MTSALSLIGAGAVLELLIRATLLIAGAWAAAAALRAAGASAAARHMAWLFGIAALLALPLVWWFAPSLSLPILPEAAAASAVGAAPPSAFAPPAFTGSTASGLPLPGGWIGLLLLAYALVAAFLLLRIAVARRVLARVWREAERASDPAWDDLLSALSLEIRLPRPVELRIANWPAMPMTWGTLAPRILLPAEAVTWSRERRRLVLLHELAHVARRDSLSRSVASLACALYWFHPGAWFAARRMFMEQEHAADDRVLIAGGSAPAYARSLLHLATPGDERLRPAHAASMAGMYQLEQRLVSIINPVRRDRPTAWFFASSALTASLATLAIASAVPVGSSSVLPDPELVGAGPPADAQHVHADNGTARDGAPSEAAALTESAPAGRGGQPRPRQAFAYAAAETRARDPLPNAESGAGQGPAAQAAERSDPAASGTALTGPSIPAISARSAAFTLSPLVTDPASRLGERPTFRLASNTTSAPSAAAVNVPRLLVDGAPARTNRIASWGPVHLSSSWAQPSLP